MGYGARTRKPRQLRLPLTAADGVSKTIYGDAAEVKEEEALQRLASNAGIILLRGLILPPGHGD